MLEDELPETELGTGALHLQVALRLARSATPRRNAGALCRMDVLAAKPAATVHRVSAGRSSLLASVTC
jgi:hypothetical protein